MKKPAGVPAGLGVYANASHRGVGGVSPGFLSMRS